LVVYKFYLRKDRRSDLIGVLPERRKIPGRITEESIMNWARKMFLNVDIADVYFEFDEVRSV